MKKILASLLALTFCAQAAFTEFYCQTTGDNLNAGSSTTDGASWTYAGGTFVAATGVYTVASGNPLTDGVLVGDYVSIYTTAGATTAIFVSPCISRDATHITVAITAATGIAVGSAAAPSAGANACTAKVRGAWKGPNAAVGFPFNAILATATNGAGNVPRVNFKNGVNYGVTAAMTHANNGPMKFQGYTSSAGDGGRAIIDGGNPNPAINILSSSGTDCNFEDLIFQNSGNTAGSGHGITVTGTRSILRRIVANNCRENGIYASASFTIVEECEAYSCDTANSTSYAGFVADANYVSFVRCIAHDNSGANADGFKLSGDNIWMTRCIADSNGRNGVIDSIANLKLMGCDLYNNGANGVDMTVATVSPVFIENCNFVKNVTAGINSTGSALRHGVIVNCGFGSGTQANGADLGANLTAAGAGVAVINKVTYAANALPWVDAPNGDFRIVINTAKGAGQGTFAETQAGYAGTVGYPDIGSAQHRDTSSSVFAQ